MKQLLLLAGLLSCMGGAYAYIPYCPGTQVSGSKHDALQYVIQTFAQENRCKIGNNCILNFASIKYSIAWSEPCELSAAKGNDPKGSTFVCSDGLCTPFGFSSPSARYSE